MARENGGDLFDFGTMTDDEIRRTVVEQLREYPNLDADAIDVRVRDAQVTLEGKVGTDAEVQVAAQVLDDVLGLDDYVNNLVVDENYRYTLPEAADDAEAALEEQDELADGDDQQSDTAEHLQEDIESETFGSQDVGSALRDGTTYIPPDRPVSDGYGSRENH